MSKGVCLIGHFEAAMLAGEDLRRCPGGTHTHLTRKKAFSLIEAGEAVWVGAGEKVLTWLERPKAWAKMPSGNVSVMQFK
jgi:hypothetical protein